MLQGRVELLVIPSFLALMVAAAANGCTINSKSGTGGPDDDDDGGPSPTSSSTNGSGGDGVGGGGGAGAGGSGGVGGTECVGDAGGEHTVAACNDASKMPIAGAQKACTAEGEPFTGDLPPLGLQTCVQGFSVYTAGSADNLFECLAQIPVDPAPSCSHKLVEDCVTKVHDEACDNAAITENCAAVAEAYAEKGQTVNQTTCVHLIRPFNNEAIQSWGECVNAEYDKEPLEMSGDDAVLTCWDLVVNP